MSLIWRRFVSVGACAWPGRAPSWPKSCPAQRSSYQFISREKCGEYWERAGRGDLGSIQFFCSTLVRLTARFIASFGKSLSFSSTHISHFAKFEPDSETQKLRSRMINNSFEFSCKISETYLYFNYIISNIYISLYLLQPTTIPTSVHTIWRAIVRIWSMELGTWMVWAWILIAVAYKPSCRWVLFIFKRNKFINCWIISFQRDLDRQHLLSDRPRAGVYENVISEGVEGIEHQERWVLLWELYSICILDNWEWKPQ